MKVSFVFTPYHHKIFEENVRIVDEEFGVFPPINLCYAAAIAKRAGHDVQVIDANASKLQKRHVIKIIKDFGSRAVGFYLSTYMVRETLEWAREIREALKLPVMAGGICTALYPADVMTNREVDFAIEGEAVRSLPMLLQAMEMDEEPANIPGVWYREDGEVRSTPPFEDLVSFDDYPFPLRDQLPNDRYYSITSQQKNFTVILTQIGCPFRCVFCPIPINKYRVRSVQSVLEEVDQCYNDYHVREIDFFDAEFPVKRERIRAICQGLKPYSKLEWSCRSRVDTIDEDLLRLMHEVGCTRIYFGIESANQEALNTMNKDINISEVWKTLRTCNKVGIRPLGFFMVGVHGETKKTFKKTVKLALNLPLDYVQYSRMIPKPKTQLDEELVTTSGRDYWQEYVRGEAGEERLPNIWSSIPERELEQMTKMAYYRFYYRPSFVVRSLLKIKSFDELFRSIRVAWLMLADYLKPELRKRAVSDLQIEPIQRCGTEKGFSPGSATADRED